MSSVQVNVLSLLLAFTGLTYEFVLAQSLSLMLGNSTIQYAVTIGLFLAGMGAGAWRSEKIGVDYELHVLFRIQAGLAVGVPTYFLALWFFGPFLGHYSLAVVAYTFVIGIGVLTGAELPLLLRIRGDKGKTSVLAFDYIGMFLACLSFPLFFLPVWGVFKTLFAVALLNSAVMIHLLRHRRESYFANFAFYILPALLIGLVFYEQTIRTWLSLRFIGSAN